MWRGRGRRLAAIVAAAVGVASAFVLPPQLGCSRFTERCHLEGETTLYSDPSLSGSSGTLFDGPSGEMVLQFITYAKSAADAGAEGGADEGGITFPSGIGSTMSGAAVPEKVVLVAIDGAGSVKSTFASPLELSQRVGGVTGIDVTYTGKGLLFSWIEQQTSTDDHGKVHTRETLRYGFATGAVPPPAHDVVSCGDCTIESAAASTKSTTFLFYAVQAQGKPGQSALLRLTPDGSVVATEPLPKTLGAAGTVPRVMTSNGALLARLAGGSYVVRDDLALAAGPFVPTGSSLSLVIGDGDPYATWLAVPGASATPDAGAVAADLGFDTSGDIGQDLMLGSFSPGGVITRLSTASIVIGVARDNGTFGVAFSSNDREYFALAGADGQKVGGDVDIGAAMSTNLGTLGNRRVIRSSRGPAHFSVLGLSGTKLTSREVTCE